VTVPVVVPPLTNPPAEMLTPATQGTGGLTITATAAVTPAHDPVVARIVA
jgi:hypothetical protein